jgi:hypothetical protein
MLAPPPPKTCPSCGELLAPEALHVRFSAPDPVLGLPPDDRADRTLGHDPLLLVRGVGAFVRVLLPVRLDDERLVTFGTWLGVHPEDLQRASFIWEEPEYGTLALDGVLANAVPPWGREVLGASCTARVERTDEVPYVEHSDDDRLERILHEPQPASAVLAAIPHAAPLAN